jgi:hypothetical protein
MRVAEAVNQPEEKVKPEETTSAPEAPVKQSPIPVREDSEFDAEDDGQLRLC